MQKYTAVLSVDVVPGTKLRIINLKKERSFWGFKLKSVIETWYEGDVCEHSSKGKVIDRHAWWLREDGVCTDCETNRRFGNLIHIFNLQNKFLNGDNYPKLPAKSSK